MPDGSQTDSGSNVEPGAVSTRSVSHPLMGSTRSEPAVRNAAGHAAPPINIRLTVPILGRRFYFAIASGRERRSRERLALERQRNPIRTKKNITFIVVAALVLYLITLGTFLLFTSF